MWNSEFLGFPHLVSTLHWEEITEIVSSIYYAKISWNQRYYFSCIIRYFHENSFKRVNFSTLHSVEKRGILSHWKNFREINSVVTLLEKQLLSRNFCKKKCERISVISTLCTHSVEKHEIHCHTVWKLQKFNPHFK